MTTSKKLYEFLYAGNVIGYSRRDCRYAVIRETEKGQFAVVRMYTEYKGAERMLNALQKNAEKPLDYTIIKIKKGEEIGL